MAQKVKITAVNGRYATTADGRQLRIIGNVNPHGTAYTDGVVVYGYGVPAPYKPPQAGNVMGLLPCFAGGELTTSLYDSVDVFIPYSADRPQILYDARCPRYLAWGGRMYAYDSGYITYRGSMVFDIRNAWCRYFSHGRFWFQCGDYSPALATEAYMYTDNYLTPIQTATLQERPADGEETMRVSLNNLSFTVDNTVPDSKVANALDAVLSDLLANDVPQSDYNTAEWISFVMCDSPTFTYRDPAVVGGGVYGRVPTANHGWRRFKRINDTTIVTWIDAIAITYVADPNRPQYPWHAQGVRFRLCVQIDLTDPDNPVTTLLYKRRTAVWMFERATASGYVVSWEDTQYPPDPQVVIDDSTTVDSSYVEDLGGGYTWDSGTKLVYKDGISVDATQYEAVCGVWHGHILGQTRNSDWGYRRDDNTSDLWWVLDGERLKYDYSVWEYPLWMDMYTIMPFRK